jgi:hypothetical protein
MGQRKGWHKASGESGGWGQGGVNVDV